MTTRNDRIFAANFDAGGQPLSLDMFDHVIAALSFQLFGLKGPKQLRYTIVWPPPQKLAFLLTGETLRLQGHGHGGELRNGAIAYPDFAMPMSEILIHADTADMKARATGKIFNLAVPELPDLPIEVSGKPISECIIEDRR